MVNHPNRSKDGLVRENRAGGEEFTYQLSQWICEKIAMLNGNLDAADVMRLLKKGKTVCSRTSTFSLEA